MNGLTSYILSKKYVESTADSLGSLKGAPCTIKSQTETDDSYIVTFEWTGTSGTTETSQLIIKKPKDGVDGLPGKNGEDGQPGKDGTDGIGISKIEKISTVDLVDTYRITFTDNSTFDYEVKNGKDGQGGSGGSGEENKIDSISVNGVNVPVDENKNVDITVPSTEGLASETWVNEQGFLTEHQDISGKVDKVDGKSLIADSEITRLASVDNYDDTAIKNSIKTVANGLMDSVGYSADYKTIDIIAKNGVKKSVNVAPIISHASITELSDVDTTNKATGKALVYNATTSKHEYADVSSTDEKVKMDSSTDAKYLGELLDNVTITNENGELKVKKLDGQEVTITEINYLKGLTMNVMDLVNMFSNGGVKIINTPVATYAELLTLDKSSFIEGISYLVYVLADENHDNAKTTYLVDKDSEIPTYFGFADSQRDFTTNPIDLATEITGKLGIANMDSDAIKALFTVDDTYKTETATNNAFSTHGAKALYDELLLAISGKANDSDLTTHKDDTNIHVSTTEKDNWNGKADASDLTAHTGDSEIHVTAEDKTLWNTVSDKVNKEDGKALLADTDKTNYDDAVTKAHTHENKTVLDGITSDKVTYWDNKSEFSGSYNDLNDKPTIDAELSNTSENAIQNKVVTKEINKLYSDISFNDFDTATDGISFTNAEDGNMLVTDWTKNLLNSTFETTTKDGVTCTRNVDANGKPDGTYTLNGTVNKNSTLYFVTRDSSQNFIKKFIGKKLKFIYIINEVEQLGKSYMCIGQSLSENWVDWGAQINNGESKIISDKIVGIVCDLHMFAGDVFNNVLIKPMLTTDLSATYDDFVPYSGYEIQSCGKNLLNNILGNGTKQGVTYSTDENGITKTSGTPTSAVLLEVGSIVLNGTYTFSGCNSNGDGSTFYMCAVPDGAWSSAKYDYGDGVTVNANGEKYDIYIYINTNVTSSLSFKPMISDTEIDFEPYTGETITVTNDTEAPAFGLKSHKGITNIISPGNVKCVYPTNESGKGVLDSLYNKDKMLTEQNKNLGGLSFSVTDDTLTITNGTKTWTIAANS